VAKLLETKLPTAVGPLNPEIFNRLVRVLEISLNSKDIDATLSVNETQRNLNKFNKGDIIYNLSTDQLQFWNGVEWIDLYSGEENGVQGTTTLGKVTIKTNGATIVPIQ
tara:strand:+ start:405 stop:731 length:327 start_codon:yes stop_codon:yes gene_type:complete